MILAQLLAAALWLAPSYFIHVGLHEGSHAMVLAAGGGRNIRVSLLPEFEDGKIISLGYTRCGDCSRVSPLTHTLSRLAPVITEALWVMLMNELRRELPEGHWLKGPLTVEVAFGLVDVWNWGRSFSSQYGDAEPFGPAALLAPVALTAGLALRWEW